MPVGEKLVDHEVELGYVLLESLTTGGSPTTMGLVIYSDYTDRETLLRNIDPCDLTSGRGFTTGKSFKGFLPVGNLFVIPRDLRRFSASVELRLYVNSELRQRDVMSSAVWNIDEILKQVWLRRDRTWKFRHQQVGLLRSPGAIPPRTLIMSGTPDGTIFSGLPFRHKVTGLTRWLFGGWDRSIASHVIDVYIRDARAGRIYLQSDDVVAMHVDRLGVVVNQIVK